MKTVAIVAALVAGLAATGLLLCLIFINPHMKEQPHVRSFQAVLPPLPKGVVAASGASAPLPSASEASALTNPLPDTAENRARGKVYYGYYCAACHGETGDGNGPVGPSLIPPAADLRGDKLRALSDGDLLRAMLTGPGHEPVLERVVHTQHRWYLVLYLRALSHPTP